ncbi:hypothetical protein MASR1M6_32720 [Rubrivivax sp.]
MQPHLRLRAPGVGHDGGVADDQRIGAELGGAVDRALPGADVARVGVGVERHQHLATARVGVAHALAHLRVVEVQAGEVARVGRVLEAQVDGVGTGVDGQRERTQRAGRADQRRLGGSGHGMGGGKQCSDRAL